jgi:microcystin-dependent protein
MEDYLGMIKIFAGTFAPNGWMLCQGQILLITQYQALYSIIGSAYGGDGKTNFALPNLCGHMPVGMGNGTNLTPVTIGESGGSANAVLTADNLPPHTHNVTGSVQLMVMNLPANTDSPADSYLAQPGFNAYTSSPGVDYGPDLEVNLTAAVTGGTSQLSVMPPYIGANFIICCTQGIYPQRPPQN